MRRTFGWLAGLAGGLVAATAATTGCADSDRDGGTDSNTHWLEPCDSDRDCGDLSCVCGQCTVPCESDGACDALTGAACVVSSACESPTDSASCVVECDTDADCQSVQAGLACNQGRCRKAPREGDPGTCSAGRCGAGPLDENPYCGAACQRLEELSQGCIGSHTEQDCVACGVNYVRVGGDDSSTPFYDERGEMVAIQIIGAGDAACADAWFGIDLSECVATGDVREVPCEDQGPGP